MLHEREESMMCAECGDEFALQVRNRGSYISGHLLILRNTPVM